MMIQSVCLIATEQNKEIGEEIDDANGIMILMI